MGTSLFGVLEPTEIESRDTKQAKTEQVNKQTQFATWNHPQQKKGYLGLISHDLSGLHIPVQSRIPTGQNSDFIITLLGEKPQRISKKRMMC